MDVERNPVVLDQDLVFAEALGTDDRSREPVFDGTMGRIDGRRCLDRGYQKHHRRNYHCRAPEVSLNRCHGSHCRDSRSGLIGGVQTNPFSFRLLRLRFLAASRCRTAALVIRRNRRAQNRGSHSSALGDLPPPLPRWRGRNKDLNVNLPPAEHRCGLRFASR